MFILHSTQYILMIYQRISAFVTQIQLFQNSNVPNYILINFARILRLSEANFRVRRGPGTYSDEYLGGGVVVFESQIVILIIFCFKK